MVSAINSTTAAYLWLAVGCGCTVHSVLLSGFGGAAERTAKNVPDGDAAGDCTGSNGNLFCCPAE
jgi:hypothetical protein